MAHPLVVHCKRSRYDVYISRGSQWGNPFRIGVHGTRDQVIDRYERWLLEQPHLIDALGELTDKTLGCWCAPYRCHGDVLAWRASRIIVPSPCVTARLAAGRPAPVPPF